MMISIWRILGPVTPRSPSSPITTSQCSPSTPRKSIQAGLWGNGCSGEYVKCNGNVLIGYILVWTNEQKEDLKSRYPLLGWTIRTILCAITLMLHTTGFPLTSTLESEYNSTVMKPLIQRATLETGASYHRSGASICQTISVASPTGEAVPPRSQICHR